MISTTLEGVRRFLEPRNEKQQLRSPAVFILEFGGGGCNKAGELSCKDFCNVPRGKNYDSQLDPSIEILLKLFPQIAEVKPSLISIVPNGEYVDTVHQTSTSWKDINELAEKGIITSSQWRLIKKYSSSQTGFLTPAEKMGVIIALGKNTRLNLSLTTNGSFLSKDLLELYGKMGLQSIIISYHPNRPFDSLRRDPLLEDLIDKANLAIKAHITPTITHVLTRDNADTFVALADHVTERDIFFALGIANARGGEFQTFNPNIEPTDEQIEMICKRLLARKIFADRHIRTTVSYLFLAPHLRNWICDQTADFFHMSIEEFDGQLQPRLNVCSVVRPQDIKQLTEFVEEGKIKISDFLSWREKGMKDKDRGCPTCTHQCFAEAEWRNGLNIGNHTEKWDLIETLGKAARLRFFFRHPIRPIVSKRIDFQNPYLWESLFQGIAREIAKLQENDYWMRTFERSGVDFDQLINELVEKASNPEEIEKYINAERKDFVTRSWKKEENQYGNLIYSLVKSTEWHDAHYKKSKLLRSVYLRRQKSAREAGLAVPWKFEQVFRHENRSEFQQGVIKNIYQRDSVIIIKKPTGRIFPMISYLINIINNIREIYFESIFYRMRNVLINRLINTNFSQPA